ncbi:MAG: SpoIIE family protein phosphatase [Thermoleophilaceae bacterium]
MPSVPLRLAILATCAVAASAPTLAKKQPPGVPVQPGATPVDTKSPDQGKKDPYDPTTATDGGGSATPPAAGPPGQPPSVKKRQAITVDKGKKAPTTSAGAASSPVSSTGATPSPTPVQTTPVTSTPVSSGGTKARRSPSKKHKSSRRSRKQSSTPSTITAPLAPRLPIASVTPAPKPAAKTKQTHRSNRTSTPATSVVTRTVHDIVKVIPGPLKAALAGLAAMLIATLAGWIAVTLRARRLKRQRHELLAEVGLLQAALLPEVPDRLGPLATSAAYRTADGPAAGGDFYDVFEMEDGRIGVVLGDVAGHGRDALARTALLRYTLRAYLETGLEPRTALRLGGETLDRNLASFATAVVAVYNPANGVLTYSCAGHPPPILLGPAEHEPITVCSSPPIGVGERTGDRQTSVVLPAGSTACFFTDGLAEARVSGSLLGRDRLSTLLSELGPEATATQLIQQVCHDVHHTPDDMAACILHPVLAAADAEPSRVEELELTSGGTEDMHRFLTAAGVAEAEIDSIVRESGARAEDYGGAIVRVTMADPHPRVSIVLPMIELLQSARR